MADGEFRIAGAFVDVHLKDNTAADEAKIRARLEGAGPVDFETALKDPDNLRVVKDRIQAGSPATIRTDADTALAQAKIKELAARRNAAIISIDADVSKAQARITDLESKRGNTKLDVDAEIGKAQAKIEALQAKKARVVVEIDVDKAAVAKAEQDVDDSVKKMASSAQTKLSPMAFAGAFAGLPAAAAAGAAGVSAALIGIPALFVGIGAAALKGNEQVASSFSNLKTQVVGDTQAMAGVLAGPLAASAGDLGASFTRLKPAIQTAMADSVPAVHTLTGAVTDFAESAMPGMVAAIQHSTGPLQGLRSLSGQAGAGVTDMLTNMVSGSDAAGKSMGTLGGVVRDAEGFTGSLLAVLANGSTGVLPQFRAAMGQVEGTVLGLASNGMPALQGASSGFLGTISGGLGIISAAAGALGSWTAPLGSLGGTMFATNSVAKLFGTSLGETGFGLKAFASSVDSAGNKTSPFKTALENAKGGSDKLKAGLGALTSGVNPLGIALVGGGLLLDAFGQSQQKAAEAAAAHRENVRTLTDAIRQDNGVLGAHTQAVNVDALTAKNAAANVAVFGGTLELAKSAIQGNAGALQVMTQKSDDAITSIGKQAGLSDTQIKGLVGLNEGLLKTGGSYDSLGSKVEGYSTKTVNAGKSGAIATDALTEAQKNQLTAIMNGTGAVGEQVKAQKDAYDAYLLSESALTGLTTAQVENRDATVAATQALYDQQNQALGYRGAVLTTQDALAAYNKTLKSGTEDQKAKDLLAVERAFAAQEQAAYNAAYANSAAVTPAQKQAEAAAAQDREVVKLANSLSGVLPQSLQTTIANMTASQAKAAGLTIEFDKTGQAVYRLPDGKPITITGHVDQALAELGKVKALQDALYNKQVTYTINTTYTYSGTSRGNNAPSQTGRPGMNAMGNLLKPGGVKAFAGGGMANLTPMAGGSATMVPPDTWRVIGDNMKVPEAYIPVDPSSKRSQDLLAQTNAMMGRGGQSAQNAGPATINQHITINGANIPDERLGAAVGDAIAWRMRTR